MAGSISLSLSQQFNELGEPLAGGLLYTYAAGTTTPQDAFKDSNLTLQHPNPIELDAAGRVPAFYLADGNIKIRLTDAAGVTQVAADNLLVIGPSSGSGSGDTVDATTILATGDIKVRYGTGQVTGFVRLNGRTIGSSTSGAAERANADAQALFEFLWTNDATLSVSTGRGLTANADWVANKTIALPDFRGRVMAGLDDMGNSAASRYANVPVVSGAATTLGSVLGEAAHALTAAEHASHDHDVYLNDPGHTHTSANVTSQQAQSGSGADRLASASGGTAFNAPSATTGIQVRSATAGGGTQNKTAAQGSGTAHNTVQPSVLITVYCKL